VRGVIVGLALGCAVAGAGAMCAASVASAQTPPSAQDLEAKVNADAARANQFGKATAGTATPSTPSAPPPVGRPGEICLLGVCTEGSARRADPVPAWAGMSQRSFMLSFLQDYVNGSNCLNADRRRKQLSSMPAPRTEADRQRQQRERDDLVRQVQADAAALKGVDCTQYQ
jgi:hypothetical protein